MGKFHIEGDWYILPDQYSWNLARKTNSKKPKNMWTDITYHRTAADAMKRYCERQALLTAGNGRDGTVSDLADILTAENKRLSELLKSALPEAQAFEEEERGNDGTQSKNLHRNHQR